MASLAPTVWQKIEFIVSCNCSDAGASDTVIVSVCRLMNRLVPAGNNYV